MKNLNCPFNISVIMVRLLNTEPSKYSFLSDTQHFTDIVFRFLGEACHLLRQTSYRK